MRYSMILLICSLVLLTSLGISSPAAHAITSDGRVIIKTDALAIKLDADHIARLPKMAQQFFAENDEIICSVATIHELEVDVNGEVKAIASTTYDLSKDKELRALEKHAAKLALKYPDQVSDITPLTGQTETNHGGWIITGLSVSRILPSSYRSEYQLQGWWDWQNGILVNGTDRFGLMWTAPYSSSQLTQFAYGTKYAGGSLSLSKHPYTGEFHNKGVLWRHLEPARSYGVAMTQIYTSYIQDEVEVLFQYVNTTNVSNNWAVDAVLGYFGLPGWPFPLPSANYYTSTVLFVAP